MIAAINLDASAMPRHCRVLRHHLVPALTRTMFIGHLSLAFAAKRLSPRTSLGWTVAAVSLLDLVWPVFVLTGVERVRIEPGATAFTPLVFDSYPWSHSLAMAIVWGIAFALVARSRGVDRRAARLLAALLVSHWVLDWITHAPDMPLWPGSAPRFGLALWDSLAGTYAVEGAPWLIARALLQCAAPGRMAGVGGAGHLRPALHLHVGGRPLVPAAA